MTRKRTNRIDRASSAPTRNTKPMGKNVDTLSLGPIVVRSPKDRRRAQVVCAAVALDQPGTGGVARRGSRHAGVAVKPQPPMSLLGPGQVWTVVACQEWKLAPDGRRCGLCGVAPATAARRGGRNGVVYRCDEHLDKYMWTSGDRVVRWRAEPYFNNDTDPRRLAAWVRGGV